MAKKDCTRFWVKVIGLEREIQVESIMSLDEILAKLRQEEFFAFGNIVLQSNQVQYIQNY